MLNKLYSFRRCPYAIRARMALIYSKIPFSVIEVDLKNKPPEMREISPKNTVPILVVNPKKIIDESLDIMHWALVQNDPDKWLPINTKEEHTTEELISYNDEYFKIHLDRFKYPNRYNLSDNEIYQAKKEVEFRLNQLDLSLQKNKFLVSDRITVADIAIFPFIRQAINVDKAWFQSLNFTTLEKWFNFFTQSTLFNQVIKK